jgi:hypothetical protein
MLEGEANVLSGEANVLSRRFGPLPDWASVRLHIADAAQPETWADVVLDATSLVEALGPSKTGRKIFRPFEQAIPRGTKSVLFGLRQ